MSKFCGVVYFHRLTKVIFGVNIVIINLMLNFSRKTCKIQINCLY